MADILFRRGCRCLCQGANNVDLSSLEGGGNVNASKVFIVVITAHICHERESLEK